MSRGFEPSRRSSQTMRIVAGINIDNDVPPELERPATLVQSLFEKVKTDGLPEEVVYLDSNVLDHRWGADTFRDIREVKC